MRKDTKKELEKSSIFDEVKKNKVQANNALQKAKAQEAKKSKEGYSYVTLADGKTKVLKRTS